MPDAHEQEVCFKAKEAKEKKSHHKKTALTHYWDASGERSRGVGGEGSPRAFRALKGAVEGLGVRAWVL